MPPVSATFALKKQRILQDLSAPHNQYSDLSPKGFVDAGIRDLIHQINELDGLVTTSSCAGRISVFFEGKKGAAAAKKEHLDGDDEDAKKLSTTKTATIGGKGGGKWLFVSHDPLVLEPGQSLCDMFGLLPCDGRNQAPQMEDLRLVRFQFEPMILHIMSASLHHAQPVLSAAINAGFRESGVQSLRNLADAEACPMVAVRTAGLALESVIGFGMEGQGREIAKSLVDEEYLRMLVAVANERFKANQERGERFIENLLSALAAKEDRRKENGRREESEARRMRKRKEGLQRQREQRELNGAPTATDQQMP